jgi:predicted Rossmann-fold nucleotide-binding protein
MQVFVSGTWKADKAREFRDQALLLGRILARNQVDLACGPGTGIARHVIDGYIQSPIRGKVRFYLPRQEEMAKVGERVEPGADEVIESDYDYPMRNVWQVGMSHGLFVLTGGDGALEEIIPAVVDYHLPVAVVSGSGSAAAALQALLQIYPEWCELIEFGDDVEILATRLIARIVALTESSAPCVSES